MRAAVFASIGGLLLAACGPSDESEGGCKDKLVAGDLVITEVFADYAAPTGGTGADEGKEWFEIFNASDRPVDLDGVIITHGRPDGSSNPKTHVMGPITVAPGTYLTLGNSTADLLPGYIDYGYSNELGEFFNSNGGKLDLTCGSTVIDSATYEGIKSGRSRQLTAAQPPDYTVNDDQINWCEAKDTEFETNNFGTPGQDNDCQPSIAGQCSDASGMRDTVAPTVGQLVITEFLANPEGTGTDDTMEWFEVANVGSTPFDLNGLGAKGNATTINVVESPECKTVAPGGTALFAHRTSAAENGGLPAVDATFTFALAQSNGSITILDGMTPLDTITWTTGITEGAAKQLDPDLWDVNANDDPASFCNATTSYGTNGDLGTPRAANVQCSTLPAAGMCDAGGGNLRPIVKPPAGALVITEFLADPNGTDTLKEWVEIKNTGGAAFDLNGLTLGRASGTGTAFNATACVSIAAGAYGLFARSTDPALNGMLPAVDATFAVSLVNSGSAASPADFEIRDGTTVLDKLTYTTTMTAGKSRQLDPDTTTAAGNDDASSATWCPGTTAYGNNTPQDLGTPKAANAQCP